MANYYVSSAGWLAVPQWAASTVYAVGAFVRQLATPAAGNERVFRCTTAGTSGATEPAWALANNATTTDGTAVFTQVGGQEAYQTAENWTAPLYATGAVSAVFTTFADTDIAYVSHDHNEAWAAAITRSANMNFVCVNRGVGSSMPPIPADLRTTGKVRTTGANALTLNNGYWYGVEFTAGDGTAAANLNVVNALSGQVTLENCGLILGTSSASSRIYFGAGSTGFSYCELINTHLTFGHASQTVHALFSDVLWRNTLNAVRGVAPATLFSGTGANGSCGRVIGRGLDLSFVTGTIFAPSAKMGCRFEDCRLAPGVAMSSAYPSYDMPDGATAQFHNCDDGTRNNRARFYEISRSGWVQSFQPGGAGRVGGATVDGVSILWVGYCSAVLARPRNSPVRTPRFSRYFEPAGAPITVSVHAIVLSATMPKQSDFWLEIEYNADADNPRSTIIKTPDVRLNDPALHVADTVSWTAPLRENSKAYALREVYSVAENPGRIFMVMTAGTSAATQPTELATAVDGAALISDGSAWVRAGFRVKMSATITPARKGVLRGHVRAQLATDVHFIVDPKLNVAA